MSIPLTPERAVYDLPSLSSASVSPDGSRIVYVRSQADRSTGKPASQIWMCDVDGSNRFQVTHLSANNSDPVWSPDGSSIAYVSRRDGDQPHAICIIPVSGGESRIVTAHSAAPSGLRWSPDGQSVAYAVRVDPENPNETPRDASAPPAVRVTRRIDYKQDGFGYLNDVRNQIFIVNAESSERRQLTSDLVDHVRPNWSQDGSRIVVVMPNRNGILSRTGVIDVESGNVQVFGAADGEVGLAAFSRDGQRIFVAADDHGGPHMSGYVIDLTGGTFTKVLDDPEYLIDSSPFSNAFPIWLDDETVLVHALLHGRSGLWEIDIATGNDRNLGTWEAVHGGMSLPSDQAIAVQTSSDLDGVTGIARVDLATGERQVLFNETESFFQETPSTLWEKCPAENDGVTIDAWLIKPADFDESKRWPLVIDIHGGPHGAYGYSKNLVAEVLAANGFLVLLVNPRGSTTYGSAYANAVKHDWGGVDWEDLQAVLDAVVARPYVDQNRTGAFGYSYGGYMTSWILGQTDRFKAVVCGAPVFDLESFFGTSDIGHVFGIEQQGGSPWQVREHMLERSPSSHIHKATTPTLVIHGETDERCPIGQGEQMFVSLLKAGCETEFARYPGGSHGFVSSGEPAHRIDVMQRTIDWFRRYLGVPTT